MTATHDVQAPASADAPDDRDADDTLVAEAAEPPTPAPAPRRSPDRATAIGYGAAVAAFAIPLVLTGFWTNIATVVVLNAAVLLSVTVITGYVGQISLGQAAFMGVGAFATGLLSNRVGLPVFVSIPLAGLVAVPFSLIIGVASLRLKGLTLAVVTLLFSTAMASIGFKNPDVVGQVSVQEFGAADSITGVRVPQPTLDGSIIGDDAYYWTYLTILLVLIVLVRNVRNGRTGRLFTAVRDSEETVWAMGSSVVTVKLLAFGLSAFVAGVGGAMFAHKSGTVSWVDFDTFRSIIFFALVAAAGLRSIGGAVLAAFLLVVPQELAIEYDIGFLQGDEYFVLSGVLLIVVTIFLPGGLIDLPRRLAERVTRGRESGEAP